MNTKRPHRKRVKHYDHAGDCHELTFSCYRRLPLLTNDNWRALFGESIDRANERHGYRLVAFVFMPEHLHLLVYPQPSGSRIQDYLYAIKRPYAFRIKQRLVEAKSPLLDRLTIRQRPDKMTFRYWQEGPGYDRNLTGLKTVEAAIDYIHLNPVRRRLCSRAVDWYWSSARHYLLGQADGIRGLPTIHDLPREYLDTIS